MFFRKINDLNWMDSASALAPIEAYKKTLFFRLVFGSWAFFIAYSFIYYWIEIPLSFWAVFIGSTLVIPTTILLHQKGLQRVSRLLFILGCNVLLYVTSLGQNHQISAEYYLLPATMAPLLLFNESQKKEIILSVVCTFMVWVGMEFIGTAFVPQPWVAKSFPMEVFKEINFFGALTISLFFLSAFIRTNFQLTQILLNNVRKETTEYKTLVKQLNETHVEMLTVFNTMSEGLVIQGQGGTIEKFNPAALEILGLSEDQLLGRTSMDPSWQTFKENGQPFPGEEHPGMVALKTNKPVRDVMMGVDLTSGVRRWIKINAVPFQGPDGTKVAVTFADMTDLMSSNLNLISLQDQNKFILKSMGIGIWKFNPVNHELNWDQSLYELYELNPKDFSGHYDAWENSLTPKAKEETVRELNLALRGEKNFDTTFEIMTPSGLTKQIGAKGIVIRDENSNPAMMYGINWDRSLEVKQEKALREALDFNEAINKSARFSIITTSLEGVITGFNPEAEKILEYSAKELIGKKSLDVFHDPSEVALVAESLSKELNQDIKPGFETFIAKAKIGGYDERKWTYITKSGRRVPVLLNVTGLYNNHGDLYGFMGIAKDISAQTELEESLAKERMKATHNAKLASLGEMSAGIAHEINNPLTLIVGNLHLLERFKDDSEKFNSKIDTIERAAARIEKIVKGLKKFSRTSEKSERKLESLAEILNEVLLLTEAKAKRFSVQVFTQFQPGLMLMCDGVEIEQVLINLVNNAFDAVQNLSDRWVRIISFKENEEIVIQVIDSGPGIDPNLEPKLFQPFFTTKAVGEGTGLGLSIAKGILDDHQAQLRINRSFANTCFEIRFPKSPSSGGLKIAN